MAAGVIAAGANAQTSSLSVVRKGGIEGSVKSTAGKTRLTNKTEVKPAHYSVMNGTPATTGTTAGKTTAGDPRWYNWVDWLYINDNTIENNIQSPYIWHRSDILSIYGDENGNPTADSVYFNSYGMVFDVVDNMQLDYNDAGTFPGVIAVRAANPYKVDSIMVAGTYLRNPHKRDIVDTLRIGFVYGDGTRQANLPVIGLINNTTGEESRTATLSYDTTTFAVAPGDSSTTAVLFKDVLLTWEDTAFTQFYVGLGANEGQIPAGNLVGVSVTFKTGDNDYTIADTAFLGEGFYEDRFVNFGIFRPHFYEQTVGGEVPAEENGNWNMGVSRFTPFTPTFDNYYTPSSAFGGAYSFDWPNMGIKVSCATCPLTDDITSVKNINNVSTVGEAFPNPANDQVSVPFTVKQTANVTVSLSNTMGQVIKTQDLGKFNANQAGKATFSVSDLSTGIYFYTVTANGQRTTKRLVVTH